jgi:hypothetical protein
MRVFVEFKALQRITQYPQTPATQTALVAVLLHHAIITN